VHSGRWSGDPRTPNAGMALYRLSRLATIVQPGQTLVSATTAALVEGDREAPALRGLGERAVPDFEDPVHVYEIVESG
jgi:class 3 adenylate cyclase